MEELSAGGHSTQFRALYYLGSQMAQALTEFEDEDNTAPQASWSVTAIELQAFAQLAERFGQDSVWGVLQYTEQPGGALLLLNLEAARALVGAPGGNSLDDDHLSILDTVLARVTEAFNQAWSDIVVLEPQLGVFPEAPALTDLQEIFVGLSPATPFACTAFRISVPGQPLVRLTLGIPQPYLIPLAQSFEAAAEMTFLNGKDDAVEERLEHLSDVPLPVSVTLGTTQMTLVELQNLEDGDIILLDQLVTDPLEIVLGGARIQGKPGTSADGLRRAVQIVQLGGQA